MQSLLFGRVEGAPRCKQYQPVLTITQNHKGVLDIDTVEPNTPIKYEVVLELNRILKADNPKFDPEKFLDASEGGEWKDT
jgi:hypothetical protein